MRSTGADRYVNIGFSACGHSVADRQRCKSGDACPRERTRKPSAPREAEGAARGRGACGSERLGGRVREGRWHNARFVMIPPSATCRMDDRRDRPLPALLLVLSALFFLSGTSAQIYQMLWLGLV